jgi:hypothetical protein
VSWEGDIFSALKVEAVSNYTESIPLDPDMGLLGCQLNTNDTSIGFNKSTRSAVEGVEGAIRYYF